MKTDVSIGVDLVEIEEVKSLISRAGQKIITKTFTPTEIEYCESKRNCFQHFAARIAAKEATFKALGVGWNKGLQWKNVEIVNDASGEPRLLLYGKAKLLLDQSGFSNCKVSISHSKTYAISTVIFFN